MPQQVPRPFSVQHPAISPTRVKQLLASDVYAPMVALVTLNKQLQGSQNKLLGVLWPVVLNATQASVIAAGYNLGEFAAANSVIMGSSEAPR